MAAGPAGRLDVSLVQEAIQAVQRNAVFAGTPQSCLQCEYSPGCTALAAILAGEKGEHRGVPLGWPTWAGQGEALY